MEDCETLLSKDFKTVSSDVIGIGQFGKYSYYLELNNQELYNTLAANHDKYYYVGGSCIQNIDVSRSFTKITRYIYHNKPSLRYIRNN